jgi:lambda family phage portal protein
MFKFLSKLKNFATKKTGTKLMMGINPHRLTASEMRAYWGDAHGMSADGWITPDMRKTWRNIARYETNCNSYARGLILTLADVGIGTGARLQLLTEDEKYNSQVEQEFAAWSEAINLGDKLKTLRKAKCIDGESFAIIVNNPKVKHKIKIDLKIVESDRVTTPYPDIEKKSVDGIHYDEYGNPTHYDVLKEHPGSLSFNSFNEAEKIPAEFMLHWYRQDRPEQSRGLTELLPSLPLFALLRRYTLSVIDAAEAAASVAAIFHTYQNDPIETLNVDGGNDYDTKNPKTIEFQRKMGIFAPVGWDITQLKAEQPTTTYQMFKREIIAEIARCLEIPINIALGDSSNYNYASGRLDHQTFHKSIKNEQNQCEKVVLFPLLEVFYLDGIRSGVFQEYGIEQISSQYARFYWDGFEHVDPTKEAEAASLRVTSRQTNHSIECARNGYDWEDVFRQLAREQKLAKELGLTEPELIKIPSKNNKDNKNDKKDSDE